MTVLTAAFVCGRLAQKPRETADESCGRAFVWDPAAGNTLHPADETASTRSVPMHCLGWPGRELADSRLCVYPAEL